ncbi:MAG: hypothetical protein AAF939_16625 [Planctomycetota bacterium]
MDYHGIEHLALFDRYQQHSHRINPVVLKFFRFCAEIFAAEPESIHVEANVIYFNLDRMHPGDQRAASWLMWLTGSDGSECPTILIDKECLDQHLSFLDSIRARNHLTLHEIGHLVLHKNELRGSGDLPKFANRAFPQHESEAWWFCYSLLGLCVSECANQNSKDSDNPDDQIWKIWLR